MTLPQSLSGAPLARRRPRWTPLSGYAFAGLGSAAVWAAVFALGRGAF